MEFVFTGVRRTNSHSYWGEECTYYLVSRNRENLRKIAGNPNIQSETRGRISKYRVHKPP